MKKTPFYHNVLCEKFRGGRGVLWHARLKDPTPGKQGWMFTGAGNTADNAIKDLQKQIRDSNRR